MQTVSAAFSAAIPQRHTRTARVTAVELDLATGVFTELQELTGQDGLTIDGDVAIDRSRQVRRTATLTIAADQAGAYTPDQIGDVFYLFSMLRLQRGLIINGEPELVDLGYYIVDQPASSFAPRQGSHRLGLSDRFAMAAEARLTGSLSLGADTGVGAAIRALAELAGLGTADSLYDLDDGGATLGLERVLDYGDLIPAAMMTIAGDHGLDLYMNAQSVLTLEPIPDPNTLPISYTFEGGPNAIVSGLTKELSARDWYNVTTAIADAPDLDGPIIGIATVTDPDSPSHSSRIGIRVKPPRRSAQIRTQDQATNVALVDLYESALEQATVTGQHVAHPALEAGDAVQITYLRAKLADRFVLDVVRHPLRDGPSTFETRRIRNLISAGVPFPVPDPPFVTGGGHLGP